MPVPRGRKDLPTSDSITEDFPELCKKTNEQVKKQRFSIEICRQIYASCCVISILGFGKFEKKFQANEEKIDFYIFARNSLDCPAPQSVAIEWNRSQLC
jgi:hypothetical protein